MMNGLAGEIDFSYEGLTAMVESGGEQIERLLETRPDVELYGQFWSRQIESGMQAITEIDSERTLDLRFEELVAEPVTVLQRISDFFELENSSNWVKRAASLVRGFPKRRFPELSSDEQEKLNAACKPGMKLLGREC